MRLNLRPLQASPRWVCCVGMVALLSVADSPAEEPVDAAWYRTDIHKTRVPANAVDDASMIGTDQCKACHLAQWETYQATTHSRSTTPTVAANEPGPATLSHPATGDRYEVIVDGADLVHREVFLDGREQPIDTTQFTMRQTIGSGAHAKTYLTRDGDFWVESPLTWFRGKGWQMSPGYESVRHFHFERAVGDECLFCHVGAIEKPDENPYRFEIVENEIGCERCHGPGSIHADRQNGAATEGGFDWTIANPGRMTRDRAEAVCQQCHTQAVQAVYVNGRRDWDFRPGMLLTDTRIDYDYAVGDEPMQIVGHFDQMHRSPCYIESQTMTCVTCHDPHHGEVPNDKVAFYRDICVACHREDDHDDNHPNLADVNLDPHEIDGQCGRDIEDRMTRNANDCVACHMPKAATNVAHVSFINHRIGVYKPGQAYDATLLGDQPTEDIRSVLPIDQLSATERARSRAIALFDAWQRFGNRPGFEEFGDKAAKALMEARQVNVEDPEVNAALAIMATFQNQTQIALALSQESLRAEKRPVTSRIFAMRTLAKVALDLGQDQSALGLYRRLNEYHRDASDWYHMGLAAANQRENEEAIAALQESIRIDPTQTSAHGALRAIYQATGNITAANEQARLIEAKLSRQTRIQNANAAPAVKP